MDVFVQTHMRIYILILISASYYYAPCMALAQVLYCVYMIRERHVIFKAALHSGLYSCLAAASYIIMLYCLVYSFFKLMLVYSFKKINVSLGNLYNYSYIYLPSFPSSCIIHNYDTMIIQVYY